MYGWCNPPLTFTATKYSNERHRRYNHDMYDFKKKLEMRDKA